MESAWGGKLSAVCVCVCVKGIYSNSHVLLESEVCPVHIYDVEDDENESAYGGEY